MILIGSLTAVIALIGNTWDQQKKRFTKIGWVALFGFVLFTGLGIWKEWNIANSEKTEKLNQYVDEIATTFSKHPIEDFFIEIVLDPAGVEEQISFLGHAQANIYFFFPDGPKDADANIVSICLLPLREKLTEDDQNHIDAISNLIPNVNEIMQRYYTGNFYNIGIRRILLYQTIGETTWRSYPLGNSYGLFDEGNRLTFSLERKIHNLPSTIEGFIGKELIIREQDWDSVGFSIISEIRFFHSANAAIPFLVLSERHNEPVGAGHWRNTWLPMDAIQVEQIISGRSTGFMFDLRSFKEEFSRTLQE